MQTKPVNQTGIITDLNKRNQNNGAESHTISGKLYSLHAMHKKLTNNKKKYYFINQG